MAGPLSSEEIEDVVSSVRRLVSNELAPRRTTRDLNSEKLLLTSALRVVSETSPLAPLILETPVDGPAATVVAEQDPALSEGDDPDVLIEADWEDEIWSPPEVASLGEAALGAEEAEVLVPRAEDQDVLLAEVEVGDDSGWVDSDPIPFVPLRRRSSGQVSGSLESAEEPALPPEVLAETEGADASSDAEPAQDEPDGPKVVLTAADEDPVKDPGATPLAAEILDTDGTPLAVLDEAGLQEIVRLMIREELQGDLGERITRNVRKLVRAEINRALMARDLD